MRASKTQGSLKYIDPYDNPTLITKTTAHTSLNRILMYRPQRILPTLANKQDQQQANHFNFLDTDILIRKQ